MPEMPAQVGLTPEQIANFQADPNQWLRQVLEGKYLGANPYIDQLIKTMEADAQRQFSEATLPTATAQLNMSGAYGTALGSQARANTARDFAQGLMGQTAGIRYEDYGSERDRMQQALQLLSGETLGSRQGLFGARDTDVQSATNIQQANIAAAAQRAAANAAAGASRYGADRGYAASRLNAQANYWNNLFGRSEQMRGFTGGQQNTPGQLGAAGAPPMAGIPGYQYKRGPETGGDPWGGGGLW